jgi:ATP-dependent Clp protease protease subunit
MKKFIISLIITLGSITAFSKEVKTVKITLKDTNVVTLRGPFTYGSVTPVQVRLLELSRTLPKNSPIFLFLDTPGGSVSAGMQLINTAKSIPQKVVTITNFSASMGFVTAQLLGPRVILPNGVFMSHRAYAGVEGQIPGELNTRVDYITESIVDIEKICAARMGISHKKYSSMIVNEYWTFGKAAVKQGAADFVGKVVCDSSLSGTQQLKVDTMFGPVNVTFSKCPLVSGPLSVDFGDTEDHLLTLQERLAFRNYVRLMLSDKDTFLRDNLDPKRGLVLRYVK